MSFDAIALLAWIPVLVSVIAIFVAKGAVTRSLRPVLVFVCEVRDEVWCRPRTGYSGCRERPRRTAVGSVQAGTAFTEGWKNPFAIGPEFYGGYLPRR
jgi:hypothetical protein